MNVLYAAKEPILMPRKLYYWPWMATAQGGTWSWSGASARIFGGAYASATATAGTQWLEFENATASPGTFRVRFLCFTSTNSGIVHVLLNGVDTGARADLYSGSTVDNVVVNSSTFQIPAYTRATLRLVTGSKNALSTGYGLRLQHICLEKVSDGRDEGRTIDDLPWRYDVPPWAYESGGATPVVSITTGARWGSYYAVVNQNEYLEYRLFLPAGTYTLLCIARHNTNRAIATVTLNGNTIGSMDQYAGASTDNASSSIAGIVVTTTGVHTLRLTGATKNVSSSGYSLAANWLEFRRTA